jgi:hypothetical protein
MWFPLCRVYPQMRKYHAPGKELASEPRIDADRFGKPGNIIWQIFSGQVDEILSGCRWKASTQN